MNFFHFRLASYYQEGRNLFQIEMASRFTYTQEGGFCLKCFKMLREVVKHKETKHTEEAGSPDAIRFWDNEEHIVRVRDIKYMDTRSLEYKEGYLPWQAGVTEQINASLHPGLRGQ